MIKVVSGGKTISRYSDSEPLGSWQLAAGGLRPTTEKWRCFTLKKARLNRKTVRNSDSESTESEDDLGSKCYE